MTALLVSVDHPDGTGVRLRINVPTDPELAAMDPLAREILARCEGAGLHRDTARLALLAEFAERVADDAAYRRECDRRGLMPL